MTGDRPRSPLGPFLFLTFALGAGFYFTYAAVQGDHGIFRRAEIEAEVRVLETELERVEAEVARLENLTHRLSDSYLDIELLDERARDVLGMLRADEIVLR